MPSDADGCSTKAANINNAIIDALKASTSKNLAKDRKPTLSKKVANKIKEIRAKDLERSAVYRVHRDNISLEVIRDPQIV